MSSSVKEFSDFSPSGLFGDLPVLKFRFVAAVDGGDDLPRYMGSAWRGLIGWEMCRLVCPFDRKPVCKACTIRDYCPYFLLFEEQTPRPGLSESPRGYVFYPPVSADQQTSELHVTLTGRCARLVPVLLRAIFNGQRSGLGKNRHPYEILFWEETGPDGASRQMPPDPEAHLSLHEAYPLRDWIRSGEFPPEPLAIRLATPVRLRQRGRYLNRMDWFFFFSSLARRLHSLHSLFHGDMPLSREQWFQFMAQFDRIGDQIRSRLRWQDLVRYSNRQRRKIPMGGLSGEVRVDRPSRLLTEWWQVAELLHVGKGAAMGLGKAEIL